MKNYLSADLHRIGKKKFRIFLVLVLAIIDIATTFSGILSDKNIILLTCEIGKSDLLYFYVIMLVNLMISFRDDIHAKSMQAALGTGLKRSEIVFVKWLSLAMISFSDLLFLFLVQLIPRMVTHKLAGSFVVANAIKGQFSYFMTILVVLPLVMIVIFQTQKAILGVLFYVYLTLNCTSGIISMAASNPIVQRFQLWKIGTMDQVSDFLTKLTFGQFDIRNFLMLAIYFAIGFGGTIYLFRRKELDF